MTPRPTSSAGFTIIELMMAMLIFALGIMSLYSLQVATVSGLSDTREVSEGTNLAARILEQFRRDSTTWVANLQPPRLPQGGEPEQWARFNEEPINKDGLFETELPVGSPSPPPRYCAKYRMTAIGGAASGTYRVEVRVMWPRREGPQALFARCPPDMDSTANIPNARYITLDSSIYRHQGGTP